MICLTLLLWCSPAFADPAFIPSPLPADHVYAGGWEHFVGGGVAILDCDQNGFPDFVVAGGENPMRLFRNRTTSAGADLAVEIGDFPKLTGVTGSYPLDIDNDGWQDLVVLRVGANVLLKGGPGCRFEDRTQQWGFEGGDAWSTAFSATWEAGRDRPTLAIGNYVNRSDPDGPFEACDENELHRPVEGAFEKQVLAPGFCALSMLFSDWDRSGVADLRISNDRHYYVRGGSEQMWAMPNLTLRNGAGWEPISIWGMGIASQDLTGDGRPEVMLTSMGDQLLQFATPEGYQTAPFEIGTFAQRPYIGDDGRPSTGWHAEFGDVNNDGLVDLFIAKGNVDQMPGNAMADPNNLLMQDTSGRFFERGGVAGIASVARSRGAGLTDFNLDGRLDLVVVNRRAPLELYQNVTPDTGNWIAVLPQQSGPNRHAIGAWVEVRAGRKSWTKEITAGGGHVSGASGPIHFGLGNAESAEFRILWPDGAASPWQKTDANQAIQVAR
ncbi:CRTAC1 family protein [Litoreibacter roseus]|uniref:ASPIC/UnbV domain-containing protein n=1 Tax=Litoreibacter roseus TaxID=2601869 RepID=A0A6N6JLT1_9RHOB|nr:CRTAC1 family protein [Litoreibacter roseus]GFE66142.1 hypothetical protein KIN_32160 [Litoreibacter roseus]